MWSATLPYVCIICYSTVDYGSKMGNGDTAVVRKRSALVPPRSALPSRVPEALSRSEFLIYDLIHQSRSVHHVSQISLRKLGKKNLSQTLCSVGKVLSCSSSARSNFTMFVFRDVLWLIPTHTMISFCSLAVLQNGADECWKTEERKERIWTSKDGLGRQARLNKGILSACASDTA